MGASYLRHFVLLEDEGDAGAAVVQVATVGLALGLQWRRGVRTGTDPPAVARRREAAEEGVLHTLVAAGARRGRDLGRRGRDLGQEAGPTAAPHLVEQTLALLTFLGTVSGEQAAERHGGMAHL